MLGVLLALAVGAGLALWLLLDALPVGALAGGRDGATTPTPAAVETVGPATVVATSSCLGDDPRDTVAVDGPAGRRLMALDACGTPVATRLTVRMAFVGSEPSDVPARLLGTGSSAALAASGPAESPLTGRLELLLTGVAALGMGGLLVAVVRERSRRAARAAARRPGRAMTTVTTSGPETRTARRAPHRPSSRPGSSPRAGRPSALDAGRRLPAARDDAGATRSGAGRGTAARGAARSRGRGTTGGRDGGRRPAAGPHRR